MKTLGELIRMHRKAKNLFIRQVAAELGIDPSLLSRIERGDKRSEPDIYYGYSYAIVLKTLYAFEDIYKL